MTNVSKYNFHSNWRNKTNYHIPAVYNNSQQTPQWSPAANTSYNNQSYNGNNWEMNSVPFDYLNSSTSALDYSTPYDNYLSACGYNFSNHNNNFNDSNIETV